VIFALMILIVVGRRASLARPLGLAIAAALCVIGQENKVQAILLIGTLPLVILPFGSTAGASVAFWHNRRTSWLAALLAVALAIAAILAAWPLIATGFDRSLLEAAQFHPLLLNRFGVYQAALLGLIAGCMIIYAAIWRISAAETIAAMAMLVAGAAVALLLLDVAYNTADVIAVLNPLEKMLMFADTNTASAANGSSPVAALLLLLQGVGSVLARYSFVLHSSARPTVLLIWLIVPGSVLAWRRGDFIFTDPLIVLAGAILIEAMPDLRLHKWAYGIAVALFGLHVAISQAEPIKYAFKRSGPEGVCEWNSYYMPLLPLPWCPPRRP
jgi:hypothetical protein